VLINRRWPLVPETSSLIEHRPSDIFYCLTVSPKLRALKVIVARFETPCYERTLVSILGYAERNRLGITIIKSVFILSRKCFCTLHRSLCANYKPSLYSIQFLLQSSFVFTPCPYSVPGDSHHLFVNVVLSIVHKSDAL